MKSQKEQGDFTANVANNKYTFDEIVRIIEKYSLLL